MARKPVKTKESGKARPGGKIPAYIRDAVADPEIAAALKAMLKNVGFTDFDAAAGDDEKSAVALLEELLAPDTKPVEGDETLADRLEHLELALTDMTVAANGGDPDARAERDGVYGLLDAAVARGTVGPVRMLSLSQTLATAGLRVPESMRAAIGAAFARLPPEAIDAMALNAFAPLFANLAESGGSAFDLHQGLSEMLEGFPDALRIELACALVRAGDDLDKDLRMAAAGFLLHPDPALANAIAAALAASASRKPVESLLVERMVRMRGWLAADRLAGVDAAVQALRRNAKAKLYRGTDVVFEGDMGSLRHEKEDVKEIKQGFECGVGFKNFSDIQPGDQLVCYTLESS